MIRELSHDNSFGSLLGVTPGLSDEARLVELPEKSEMTFSPSITHTRTDEAIVRALWRTFVQTQEAGWDGYDAIPVSASALAYAWQFLSDLPSDIDMPDLSADADGDVSLDWDYGPRNVFSVRIARDGTVYYSGLFGHATYHGSEVLGRGIPDSVAKGISRAIRLPRH